MRGHVQLGQRDWTELGETLDFVVRDVELVVQRLRHHQRQRLREIPEQLVQLPHDAEHLEHLWRRLGGAPPVQPAEGDLGHVLTGAEAVVHRAAGEALLPQPAVDAAAEVLLQVRAWLPGRLVDREVC